MKWHKKIEEKQFTIICESSQHLKREKSKTLWAKGKAITFRSIKALLPQMRLRKKKERILCKNKERFAWKRVAHVASRRGALLSGSI